MSGCWRLVGGPLLLKEGWRGGGAAFGSEELGLKVFSGIGQLDFTVRKQISEHV